MKDIVAVRHIGIVVLALLPWTGNAGAGGSAEPLATCGPDMDGVAVISGEVDRDDAKSYRLLPFEVLAGTERIEVGYRWQDEGQLPSTPLTQTVFDLGLRDADGYDVPEGFRGWSGSRQGRIDQGQAPVWVEAGSAERGYVPGAIETGTWWVDLGVAAVAPEGATYTVEVRCLGEAEVPEEPDPDPVDPSHVAVPNEGWFHGDFHMHAYHSHPNGPSFEDMVSQARAAELDFLMVTEYVTGRHWNELGKIQRNNEDLVIWPGREIITYYGHANTHGETPGVLEYRHGFRGISLGDIQERAKAAGALFQVNHPTTFPGPVFSNFCRGCAFELGDEIDWDLVDTIEVVTGPILVNSTDAGLPELPGRMQNPFTQPAIDFWEDLLNQGYRITGVSGSDSKGVEPSAAERRRAGYGSSATAVYATELSRDGLTEGILAGHAYVRTRGVAGSPELRFQATTEDGRKAIFGDILRVGKSEVVRLKTTVRRGAGQILRYLANGEPVLHVPVTSDDFEHELPVSRLAGEGPLGTFWRVETLDAESLTTLGNPVFLQGK